MRRKSQSVDGRMVHPTFPAIDCGHVSSRDSKFGGDLAVGKFADREVSADFFDLLFRELRASGPLSRSRPKNTGSVKHVLAPGDVLQIRCDRILSVAINVINFVKLRDRTKEGYGHQGVDVAPAFGPSIVEVDEWVPIFEGRPENSPKKEAMPRFAHVLYSAEARHEVCSATFNRKPDLALEPLIARSESYGWIRPEGVKDKALKRKGIGRAAAKGSLATPMVADDYLLLSAPSCSPHGNFRDRRPRATEIGDLKKRKRRVFFPGFIQWSIPPRGGLYHEIGRLA